MEKSSPQSLYTRTELPPEYRLILAEYPRDGWSKHPDFNGLAAFWLDRHLNFRAMMHQLTTDAEARIDARVSPQDYGKRLYRLGSSFLSGLEGHHQVEDTAYFPQLAQMEPRIARGFDLLDGDHHDLQDLINRFAAGANDVLRAAENDAKSREMAAAFHKQLVPFAKMLDRHLTDEEDLVLPVVLKHRVT